MRENRILVLPVNILMVWCAGFTWLHDTLPCVLIFNVTFLTVRQYRSTYSIIRVNCVCSMLILTDISVPSGCQGFQAFQFHCSPTRDTSVQCTTPNSRCEKNLKKNPHNLQCKISDYAILSPLLT